MKTGPIRVPQTPGLVPGYNSDDENGPLSTQLPPGWAECPDPEGSGDTYFWNVSTGEVTWVRPRLTTEPENRLPSEFSSHVESSDVGFSLTESERGLLESTSEGACDIFQKISETAKSDEKLKIKIWTRLEDFRAGGLSSDFFCRRLREMAGNLPTTKNEVIPPPKSTDSDDSIIHADERVSVPEKQTIAASDAPGSDIGNLPNSSASNEKMVGCVIACHI